MPKPQLVALLALKEAPLGPAQAAAFLTCHADTSDVQQVLQARRTATYPLLVAAAGTQNGPASQLLDDPPPLRLSPKPSAQPAEFEASPPSTDDEDHSSVFNANSLASPLSAAVSKPGKPTALKTDPSLGGNPSGSQVWPVPSWSAHSSENRRLPGEKPLWLPGWTRPFSICVGFSCAQSAANPGRAITS